MINEISILLVLFLRQTQNSACPTSAPSRCRTVVRYFSVPVILLLLLLYIYIYINTQTYTLVCAERAKKLLATIIKSDMTFDLEPA